MYALRMMHSRLHFLMDVKYPYLWNGFRACAACAATPKQRKNWRLIARGIGIHWEDVDEDISVATLLRA